jgi:hypothetical protein
MSTPKTRRDSCKRLRSKSMFIESEPDPTVPRGSDGFYWCSHTQTCLGPDGEVATREKCNSGRNCFETH